MPVSDVCRSVNFILFLKRLERKEPAIGKTSRIFLSRKPQKLPTSSWEVRRGLEICFATLREKEEIEERLVIMLQIEK